MGTEDTRGLQASARWDLLARPSMVPSLSPEPDNEAHMRSVSRPCSPVHHHEGHPKLASTPPRASPVRMGPSYVLKKGSESGGQEASRAPPWGLGRAVEREPAAAVYDHSAPGAVLRAHHRTLLRVLGREWGAPSCGT